MAAHNSKTILIILCFLFFGCLAFAEQSLILNKVILEGLSSIPAEDVIKNLNLQPKQIYEPQLSNFIIEQIQYYLTQKGLYFAQIKQTDIIPLDNFKVNLVFHIEEGYSGKLSDIRFSGNRYFSSDKLNQLIDLNDKRQIQLNQIPDIMNKILNLYTSRSYLFVQVKLDSLTIENERLLAVIGIDEGPVFKPDKYNFTGNKITKNGTILRITGLAQTKQFTPEKLIQAENNVLKKAYIKDCKIIPLDGRTLSIEISEDKMTKAEGVIGITTDPITKKRNFTGLINLQFLNLWGTDRAINLYWKSLKAYRLLELSYHESGLKDYPFAADVHLQRAQQDSAWIRLKVNLRIYYNHLSYKLGSDVYTATLYSDSQDSTIIDTRYYNVSLFGEYSKTDYDPNPSIGSQARIKSGWILSNAENESKTIPINEIDVVTYLPVMRKFVYSLGLHFREISNHNAKLYEQYKMGGFNSLRGYNEEAFSSWRLGWANSELRYLMTRNSRVFLLFDVGVLQLSQSRIKTDLIGTGIGLSLKTRIGIMSVSYALAISNERISDIKSGMLHMGLVSSF